MRAALAGLALVLGVLSPVYLATLQTIPNGSEHYYMIDVGETQIVLNVWGTLHATGYPLYILLSAPLTAVFRALGAAPAAAPGLASLVWMLAALTLIYALAWRLLRDASGAALLAAAATLLLGLTRTVWIHAVVAEIYSFGLLLLAGLLALALWPGAGRRRVYGLALLGGVGVFHHRALIMAAPALVYAVWPQLLALGRGPDGRWQAARLARRLALCLLLGLIGLLPYLYLVARGQAQAAWVYGQPGTWDGFWDQFLGREAAQFIGAPAAWDGLAANIAAVHRVLLADLTAPGLLLGLAGLLLALRPAASRRAAGTLLLSALAAYLFHVLAYTDILSALILPALVSAAFGWAFLARAALAAAHFRPARWALGGAALAFAGWLVAHNAPFIHEQTTNPTGLETIALLETAPPGADVMLAWGPRYFAAGFAQDVLGQLAHIRLLDHRADFAGRLRAGARLVTPAYTFYNQPVSWWQERLGMPIYLRAAGYELVQIGTRPERAASPQPAGVALLDLAVDCAGDALLIRAAWAAGERPARDRSVFVHLLDAAGDVIAQGDQAAPVYGWRPLTTWEAGEIVRDVYRLPRLAAGRSLRLGLYWQRPNGEFVNESVVERPVRCEDEGHEATDQGG